MRTPPRQLCRYGAGLVGLGLVLLLAGCGASGRSYNAAAFRSCLHARGARTIPFASFATAIDTETGSQLISHFPGATAAVFSDNEFVLFAAPPSQSQAKSEQSWLSSSWTLTPVTVTRTDNLVLVTQVDSSRRFLQTLAACQTRAAR